VLTSPEKIIFALASLTSAFLGWRAGLRIARVIGRGNGRPDWQLLPRRGLTVLWKMLSFSPVFKARFWPSFFHNLVAWGFIYYLSVNAADVLAGFIPDFHFLGVGLAGDIYRLGADVLSIVTLAGMIVLLVRRFGAKPDSLRVRDTTLLHPKARERIGWDSAIVGGFILAHVGARFLGESFYLALQGPDAWQPFASALSGLWASWSATGLVVARHAAWWASLGLIMAFIPYFAVSKHVHLFVAPLNFLLRPERRSLGELQPLDFEDESVEQFGAQRLEDLSWAWLMDAYACIMCNRCQDACPAYTTGKVLSPAAMEINKRYLINERAAALAGGKPTDRTLTESAIPKEAIWGCTACGACVEICPVANEPMHDIIEIRRHLVLMENDFPEQLQTAYRGMERVANPWNIPPENRLDWAQGLDVPTVRQNPGAEWLWWVGCAPATDPKAQQTARALAKILAYAGVDFAVLGPQERCTGDSARRSGNEYLFHELALNNVEILNEAAPAKIFTTCPHCLHTLANEYPAFGGDYHVVHHTQLLAQLIDQGKLRVRHEDGQAPITFHDPCYLGRMNSIFDAPRQALLRTGLTIHEMARRGPTSFCCGAGGAQMWKEEESGRERVSENRYREAQGTGASTLAVGCPFCKIMLSDASAATGEGTAIPVRDVAEIIADSLG
jgi:Fe-S oxidoreductase